MEGFRGERMVTEIDKLVAKIRNAGSEAYNRAYKIHGNNGYERVTLQMKLENEIADEATQAIKQLLATEVIRELESLKLTDWYGKDDSGKDVYVNDMVAEEIDAHLAYWNKIANKE